MSPLDELLALERTDREPWYCEPKDKDPRPEIDRQIEFLAFMKNHAPKVDVVAIPNAGKGTDWERLRRWREGARAGALDLVITWQPTHSNDSGVFFAEFKDGKKMPSESQIDRLDRYSRMGHGCGVFRTAKVLANFLYNAGCPIRGLADDRLE